MNKTISKCPIQLQNMFRTFYRNLGLTHDSLPPSHRHCNPSMGAVRKKLNFKKSMEKCVFCAIGRYQLSSQFKSVHVHFVVSIIGHSFSLSSSPFVLDVLELSFVQIPLSSPILYFGLFVGILQNNPLEYCPF